MVPVEEHATDVPQPGPSAPPRTAKIILIGDSSVGKTSLRNRYFRGSKGFSQAYIATIGADFVTKKVQLEDGTTVSVQLWDTAGQERFQALGAAFYRGADACILVYSCTSRQSYEKLDSWYHSFVDRCPVPEGQEKTFPFICIGNKQDLVRSTNTADLVDQDEVQALLYKLLPHAVSEHTVKKDQHPSALPIATDTKGVKAQQDQELHGRRTRQSIKRRGSSTSTKRRSLEILPDTLHRSNSRGPSVYHTPSSSLAHPSWAIKPSSMTSSSPGQPSSSFLGREQSLDAPPPDSLLEEDEEGHQDGAEDDDEPPQQEDVFLPAKDVFGARDGIKHFRASAKSGENLDIIFDYLVKRISARWKWQEEQDNLNGFLDFGTPKNVKIGGKNDSVKVGDPPHNAKERKGWRAGCC